MLPPSPALPPARPPSIAPLELERLRGSVRAGLFAEPAKPPRLGRYSLLRCIGHGGMGVVYAAHDEELDREVAIKLLRTEIARGDDQRLAQEARALARLSHPNVVAIYDVGVHDQQRFIAMELVAGLDLRRWLAAPRPLREVLRVFAAAGHGLAAAHAVGLVHRDFKPDNVLVGDDGRPRVLDFGLARPPERAEAATPGKPPVLPTGIDPFATTFTSTGMLLGTPAYMAPEQYLGDPADARSDQFSFAVSLFHAVYGERPFAGENPHELALSIVRGRVQPITPRYPVPPWLEQLLARSLRVDPAQRFGTMVEVVELIERGIEHTPGLDALPTRPVAAPEHAASVILHDSDVGSDALAQLHAVVSRVPAAREVASVSPAGAAALALPPEVPRDGVITSLSVRRHISGEITAGARERIARELARLEGRRGKLALLGRGFTWSNRALEVHVDVDATGTRVLVWRKLARSIRKRRVLWTVLGVIAGGMGIAVADGIGLLNGGLEPLIVFGLLGTGGAMGMTHAQQRHTAALPAERAELEFIADRVAVLAASRDE